LWISRINAASRSLDVSYSKLMNGLNNKNIMIDRKILSDIAIHDSSTFKKIVQSAVK
jgi:large subunit ribosomal protein L20